MSRICVGVILTNLAQATSVTSFNYFALFISPQIQGKSISAMNRLVGVATQFPTKLQLNTLSSKDFNTMLYQLK